MASAPAGQATRLQWWTPEAEEAKQIGPKGVSARNKAEEERATLGEEVPDARGDIKRERKGPGLRFRARKHAALLFFAIDVPRAPVIKSDTAAAPARNRDLIHPRGGGERFSLGRSYCPTCSGRAEMRRLVSPISARTPSGSDVHRGFLQGP